MFEEIISQLESFGLDYVDNGDGTITVDISAMDKVDVVNAVQMLNDAAIDYTISADSIVINAGEPLALEEDLAEDVDGMDMAMADLGL